MKVNVYSEELTDDVVLKEKFSEKSQASFVGVQISDAVTLWFTSRQAASDYFTRLNARVDAATS